jgi:3-hydroxyacyl-CoA dehydrogenase
VRTDFKKAVVLGAGTMGAQVAAHVVAQGLDVALLDVAGTGDDRSAAARKGRDTLKKLNSFLCPNSPMSQQTSGYSLFNHLISNLNSIFSQ